MKKSERLQESLDAVKQDGLRLEFVDKQTPEICLAAVKQKGLALRYVKEQTPEICLAAVRQNEKARAFKTGIEQESPRHIKHVR